MTYSCPYRYRSTPPFFDAPKLAGRNIIQVPMIEQNGRLTFDLELFESKITKKTSLLLCTPHNPGGTVFTKEELTRIASVICSDEIYCGLVLDPEKQHIPTATLDEETSKNTITLMAPSKTYNIPGLGFSFAVIPDEALRTRFRLTMEGIVPHIYRHHCSLPGQHRLAQRGDCLPEEKPEHGHYRPQ